MFIKHQSLDKTRCENHSLQTIYKVENMMSNGITDHTRLIMANAFIGNKNFCTNAIVITHEASR